MIKLPQTLKAALETLRPAAATFQTAIQEKRAKQAALQAEAAALTTHPSDRKDLEAALARLIDDLIEDQEAKFEKYLSRLVPSPDPLELERLPRIVKDHLHHPQWHATELPELAALLLPGVFRAAVPELAARMAARMAAFPVTEIGLAERQAKAAALNEEAQRLSAETKELEAQAREAGLAV